MSFESYYAGASFYCADTCDPSPCATGEECELVSSCSGGSSSCVPVAYCSESTDPCDGECSEFQVKQYNNLNSTI